GVGLSTYAVRPLAAGTAAVSRTPDHRRVAKQPRASARVIAATGFRVPRSDSQFSSPGYGASPAWIRESNAASSHPGSRWPATRTASAAVSGTQAATSPAAGQRSGAGKSSRGPGLGLAARFATPRCIGSSYAAGQGPEPPLAVRQAGG